MSQPFVPVVSLSGKPLMPTNNRKANKLIAQGRAVRRFDRGIFYIQLLDRADGYIQPIAVGIDPGSKKEAYTVKSQAHTYLNIQADAVTWVKDAETISMTMRRNRRSRHTPYRACRSNRKVHSKRLPPSTRARWGWKLRLCTHLAKLYPISVFVVEEVAAKTRPGKRKWNRSFSPLEVGKLRFYEELGKLARVETRAGYETKTLREALGLKKSKAKMSDKFEAHCVDSWVLANAAVGGHTAPENTAILYMVPLRFHRRQLHRLEAEKGGKRKAYGGMDSQGLKRGSWVRHPKYGVCYVGGTMGNRISLHSLETGKRLTQKAKPADCQFLCRSSWRIRKGKPTLPPRA